MPAVVKNAVLLSMAAVNLLTGAGATAGTPSHRAPVPRCEQFLTPVQGDQILILPREAYGLIRQHSLFRFAQRLREKGTLLKFGFHRQGGGYEAQSAMLKRVLAEIFPESFKEPRATGKVRKIEIDLSDSPLHNNLLQLPFSSTWKDPATLQMARIKPGNPLIPVYDKKTVRQRLRIPETARVLHVYFDGDEMPVLEQLYGMLPEKPDLIIMSPTGHFSPFEDLESFSDMPFRKLSRINEAGADLPTPGILYNDERHRMFELYTAADYAFVIGANNIFEPLRARCPTLIFRGRLLSIPGCGNPVSYYHPVEWNKMAGIAERTGGAISIHEIAEAFRAFPKLFAIDPATIRNPAFTPDTPGGKTPFEIMLDDLERSIRHQINKGTPPLRLR